MQNNTSWNYFNDKAMNGHDKYPRRMSTSGFDYPKNVSNVPYSLNITTIPEIKYQNNLTTNVLHNMYNDTENKSEIGNPTFSSENNVRPTNRSSQNSANVSELDRRYFYNYSSFIPKFCSTPSIGQSAANHLNDSKTASSSVHNGHPLLSSFFHNTSNHYHNRQTDCSPQIHRNDTSLPFFQSPFVVYDANSNSYQNVLIYPHSIPVLPSVSDATDTKAPVNGHSYTEATLLPPQQFLDLKDDYLACQLSMAQQNLESSVFVDQGDDDFLYMPKNLSDVNRTESQSMPSLRGDDIEELDFETSDDDQLNTVHGEEMLHELQKMSSVFTNVVNLPLSGHNDVLASALFPDNNFLSRFKKTRIKERTTFWRMERCIVKDNRVKIIPEKVLNMRPIGMRRPSQFDLSILEYDSTKKTDAQPASPETPTCVHSTYQCRTTPNDFRYLKYSGRTNQKYRPTFKSHSPTDTKLHSNQVLTSAMSSRHSLWKSMQIPLRIPFVWNPSIPLLSPAVKHCNRRFFEPSNIFSSRNSRRKRRRSLSGTKFENYCSTSSIRSHNVRQTSDSISSMKHEIANEYFENRHSLYLQDLNECKDDHTSSICSNLESNLDKQLGALKDTLMSFVEGDMSDIRNEILSLRNSQLELEKELKYYKEKVQSLERCVRITLPREQWTLLGVGSGP